MCNSEDDDAFVVLSYRFTVNKILKGQSGRKHELVQWQDEMSERKELYMANLKPDDFLRAEVWAHDGRFWPIAPSRFYGWKRASPRPRECSGSQRPPPIRGGHAKKISPRRWPVFWPGLRVSTTGCHLASHNKRARYRPLVSRPNGAEGWETAYAFRGALTPSPQSDGCKV